MFQFISFIDKYCSTLICKSGVRTFLFILLLLPIIQSCSIEKRRYTSGFHIEKWHSRNDRTHAGEIKENSKTAIVPNESSPHSELDSDHWADQITEESKPAHKDSETTKSVVSSKKIRIPKIQLPLPKVDENQAEIQVNSTGKSNVHPDAYTSFLSGLASIGCLIAIFLTGASPLFLFVLLLIFMLLFAFLASRLANRAFRDMRYARDRYSGKALAAAGLIMGILSIAAFIGLLLITILGIAFANFT